MFCNNCGKKIAEGSKFCPECGSDLTKYSQYNDYRPINETDFGNNTVENPDDSSSFGYALLSFVAPIIGIVLFIVWNKEYPKRAKSCLQGLIAGVVIGFVFGCCMISSIYNATENYNNFNVHFDMFIR